MRAIWGKGTQRVSEGPNLYNQGGAIDRMAL